MTTITISVKDVLDAYKYITDKPIRGKYFSSCGVCGLTAIYLKEHQHPNITGAVKSSLVIERWSEQKYGLVNCAAFIRGFDGTQDKHEDYDQIEIHFFEVGRESARQLFGAQDFMSKYNQERANAK